MSEILRFSEWGAPRPMLPKHRIVVQQDASGCRPLGVGCFIRCACGWLFVGTDWMSIAVARERALTRFYNHCLIEEDA